MQWAPAFAGVTGENKQRAGQDVCVRIARARPLAYRARMAGGDTRAIVAWLIDGARSGAAPEEVLAELCERLVACGVPLWRVGVFVRTLHPEVMGRRLL